MGRIYATPTREHRLEPQPPLSGFRTGTEACPYSRRSGLFGQPLPTRVPPRAHLPAFARRAGSAQHPEYTTARVPRKGRVFQAGGETAHPAKGGVSEIMRLRRRRLQAISGPAVPIVTEREDRMKRSGSPAIPGTRHGRSGTSLRPPREFPEISINIDKFTGFFDKFPKIYEGKCAQLRGVAGVKSADEPCPLPLSAHQDVLL